MDSTNIIMFNIGTSGVPACGANRMDGEKTAQSARNQTRKTSESQATSTESDSDHGNPESKQLNEPGDSEKVCGKKPHAEKDLQGDPDKNPVLLGLCFQEVMAETISETAPVVDGALDVIQQVETPEIDIGMQAFRGIWIPPMLAEQNVVDSSGSNVLPVAMLVQEEPGQNLTPTSLISTTEESVTSVGQAVTQVDKTPQDAATPQLVQNGASELESQTGTDSNRQAPQEGTTASKENPFLTAQATDTKVQTHTPVVQDVSTPKLTTPANEANISSKVSSGESDSVRPSAVVTARDGTLELPAGFDLVQQAVQTLQPVDQPTKPVTVLQTSEAVTKSIADVRPAGDVVPSQTQEVFTLPETPPMATPGQTAQTGEPQPTAMGEQVVTHIRLHQDELGQEMTVQMNPPELGKVRVQFRMNNGELEGVIRAENPQTLVELRREGVALLQRLGEAGLQVRNLEFQMDSSGQNGRDNAFAQAQNAYTTFGQGGDGQPNYGESLNSNGQDGSATAGDESGADTSETSQYVSDTAVNIMM